MSGGIELPWPPRELHPNARPHHMQRAKAAKAYREQCYWAAYQSRVGKPRLQGLPLASTVPLIITFHPPDKRRRDIDGMLSNIKSGLDGIADGLLVDDSRFELTLRRGEPVKGGRVVIVLGETA